MRRPHAFEDRERVQQEETFRPGNAHRAELQCSMAWRAALRNCTYQANEIRLFNDGNEICAMIGEDPVQGVAGFGPSVSEALRDLANQLTECGVSIEVTDPDHPFNWTEPPKLIE